MKISTKGRYALRLMVDLAIHDTGDYTPLRKIAERQGLTVKYLEQIMPSLTRAGLVRSARGANSGYRLTKSPAEYTAGQILRAAEGTLSPIACLDDTPNQCPRSAVCATLPFWQGLQRVIDEYTDQFTLADLAANDPEDSL